MKGKPLTAVNDEGFRRSPIWVGQASDKKVDYYRTV